MLSTIFFPVTCWNCVSFFHMSMSSRFLILNRLILLNEAPLCGVYCLFYIWWAQLAIDLVWLCTCLCLACMYIQGTHLYGCQRLTLGVFLSYSWTWSSRAHWPDLVDQQAQDDSSPRWEPNYSSYDWFTSILLTEPYPQMPNKHFKALIN